MQIADFDYPLPPDLIAQTPLPVRTRSRLLQVNATAQGGLTEHLFQDLVHLLRPGDLLVLNDTRVIKAALQGLKPSGGKVSLLIERIFDQSRFCAQIKASKALRPGARVQLPQGVTVEVTGRQENLFELELVAGADSVPGLLKCIGTTPLPPYIRRPPGDEDLHRYQTVYASRDGAVAAPTAGLHFDQALLDELVGRGVELGYVTLHVGAGTFQPLRHHRVQANRLHPEQVRVGPALCAQVAALRRRGGRLVAVGTTVARALETAASGGPLCPFQGETGLFIYPGFRFACIDGLITNFHQPRSSLLMLVCALGGQDRVLCAYRQGVARGFRFFSYGDAMLVWRDGLLCEEG